MLTTQTAVTTPTARTADRYLLVPPLAALFCGTRLGNILDISTNGVRIEHAVELERGTDVALEFSIAGSDVRLSGRVVWSRLASRKDDARSYVSGIAFHASHAALLPSIGELIDRRLAFRVQELRQGERFDIGISLRGTFTAASDVEITNLSERGARVRSRNALRFGQRGTFSFRVPNTSIVINAFARVAWSHVIRGAEGIQYEAGLSIEEECSGLAEAIEILVVRGDARLDVGTLKQKHDIVRARTLQRARQARISDATSGFDDEILIAYAYDQIKRDPECGRLWLDRAQRSTVAAPAGSSAEIVLAIWEYLERQVDLDRVVAFISLRRALARSTRSAGIDPGSSGRDPRAAA